jgi:hypothetical protein
MGVAIGMMACGSTGSGTAASSGPSCSNAPNQGEVKVQGTLGGQPVNVDQSPTSGGLSQVSTGQFDLPTSVTINGMPMPVNPADVQIHVTWAHPVPDGSTTAAMGTLVLPTGQPFGQMSLCAGAGTTITPNAQTHGLDLVFDHLTLGPACTQAVAGQLQACWGWTP